MSSTHFEADPFATGNALSCPVPPFPKHSGRRVPPWFYHESVKLGERATRSPAFACIPREAHAGRVG
jgi:hypothetical protein